MSEPRWYLIAYDIRSPRRLRKVQHHLRACGYPLQESVFAWHGNRRELVKLQQALKALINESEDDIRGYPILEETGILWWGCLPWPQGVHIEDAPPLHVQAMADKP